jgi:hypothetical protein
VNREQLRLRMRALVGPMTGAIEAAADEIAASSPDRAVQRAALDWKIQAVPALREALFQPDPSLALMDAWVLLLQMSDYFDRGPGKKSMAGAGTRAAAACRQLEKDITRVAASATVSGDVSKARDFVRQWATDHPITGTIAAREPVLAVSFRRELGDSLTLGGSAAEIAITLDDLNRKFEVYSGQLLRQARWELNWQTGDVLEKLSAERAVPLADRAVVSTERVAAAVDRLVPVLEHAARATDGAPDLLARERQAAVDALAADLSRTFQFAERERLLVLEFLTAERKATLDDLGRGIEGEKRAFSQEAERLSTRVVDHAIDRLERLVRTVLLIVFGAVVAILVMVRLLFFGRRAGTRNGG